MRTRKGSQPRGVEGHYFAPKPPASPSERWQVVFDLPEGPIALVTAPGVFSPRRVDPGTRLLAQVARRLLRARLPEAPAPRVLDLGAGYGALTAAVLLGVPQAQVDAVEVDPRALDLCRENLARLHLSARARLHLGDGPGAVAGEHYDLVMTNPPIRAGRSVYGAWPAQVAPLLHPEGAFILVVRTRQGAPSLERLLQRHYRAVAVEERHSGYRVLSARLPYPSSS